jgi:hypothetical protein
VNRDIVVKTLGITSPDLLAPADEVKDCRQKPRGCGIDACN